MEDFPVDPTRFIFSFPVWICSTNKQPVRFPEVPVEGGGKGFFIFTDKPAAQEYLATLGPDSGTGLGQIPTKAHFRNFLDVLAELGITHLVLDDRGRGPGHKRSLVLSEVREEKARD